MDQCLDHKWLSQDVKYMRAKRLSTDKHKRFMARRKWQVCIASVHKVKYNYHFYRSQTKFAKVMFLHLSVILFTEGCLGPHPRGRFGGLAGGCLGPHPGGGWGVRLGVCPGPHPEGVLAWDQWGGECIPECTEADTQPPAYGYCCGWYASYWNAFLLLLKVKANRLKSVPSSVFLHRKQEMPSVLWVEWRHSREA